MTFAVSCKVTLRVTPKSDLTRKVTQNDFSSQKVACGVTSRVTLRETVKVTFESLLSGFELFGVSGLLVVCTFTFTIPAKRQRAPNFPDSAPSAASRSSLAVSSTRECEFDQVCSCFELSQRRRRGGCEFVRVCSSRAARCEFGRVWSSPMQTLMHAFSVDFSRFFIFCKFPRFF